MYAQVLDELSAGRKTTHWMWFVFPQVAGLGFSDISRRFAISGREEALAYVHHPVLGARLLECTRLVNAHHGRSAHQIFASPDDLKFHSCMTLFAEVAPEHREFSQALRTFYDGRPDEATIARL